MYFIALHPHRDQNGVRHLGISAPYAAFFGVIAAFLVSCVAFGMPLASAASAFVLGTLSGFLGIIWIVLAAMFLYTTAYLGWLGVFLTGSDTASNALFGSLQRITAEQLGLNPILIVATNSTGGVMGKIIDAQSIMVACAACYDEPRERAHALGPIFRTVFWHSIGGAALIGLIALLQAYVFTGVIPIPPVK